MTTSAETVGQGVVKSGWLHRQSDFLRRWKRDFCVLQTNGRFVYYTSESKKESEGSLNLCNCYAIKVGHPKQNATPPPTGYSRDSMFEVKTPENIITFCADSTDEAEAWRMSMMEAKQANTPPTCNQRPNTGVYTTQYAGAPPPYMAAPPPYAPTVTTTTNYGNGHQVMVQRTVPAVPNVVYPVQTGSTSTTTTTTYRNGRQVVVQQSVPGTHNVVYPIQASAYGYPGQTVYTTYRTTPGTTVIPGQTVYHVNHNHTQYN